MQLRSSTYQQRRGTKSLQAGRLQKDDIGRLVSEAAADGFFYQPRSVLYFQLLC